MAITKRSECIPKTDSVEILNLQVLCERQGWQIVELQCDGVYGQTNDAPTPDACGPSISLPPLLSYLSANT